jgi:hypothetical protein
MKKERLQFNPADFEPIRQIALRFPGTEDDVSHENTPSIKVRGKLMCRLHDNGEFIPIRLNFATRDEYLSRHPEIFLLPEHFKNYPYICMYIHRYDSRLLKEVLELSWRGLASKKQIAQWEASQHQ